MPTSTTGPWIRAILAVAGITTVLAGCSSATTTGSATTGASGSVAPASAPATAEPVLGDGQAALRLTLDGCDDCTVTLQSTGSGKLDWASQPIAMAQAEGPVWVTLAQEHVKGLSVLVTSPAAPGNWGAVLNYDNAAVASKPNPGAFSSYQQGFACLTGALTDNKGTLSLAAQVVPGPALAVYSLQALPAAGPANPLTNGALKVAGEFLSCKA